MLRDLGLRKMSHCQRSGCKESVDVEVLDDNGTVLGKFCLAHGEEEQAKMDRDKRERWR